MSRPLPPGDPLQLGPFRLSARLSESPAGIVYLGVDGSGRRVSVAVLTRGAAQDAAARDRFRAAVLAEPPGRPPGEGGAPPVVAAQPDGPAPWVATVFEPERPGAERFLAAVSLSGEERAGGRGPWFQPYWAGSREPAMAPPAPPVPAPAAPVPGRGLAAAVVTLLVMLGALLVLLLLLFACEPQVTAPVPVPSEFPSETYRPPAPPSPPEVSPSPSPSGSPSPSPGGTGPGSGGGPL